MFLEEELEMVKTCPFCSNVINTNNECDVCCPAYRKPEEREKLLKVIHQSDNKEKVVKKIG